ncbi:Hsp20 family protein [Bacillus sp. FJAT-44742]|uniref:Hsp20 family protein n=1 Tax=Bacillus sp. FJAT-44742 TaxID=2014005 RepID=UPI000C232951
MFDHPFHLLRSEEGTKNGAEADLPGCKKEDIDIEYSDNCLTIKAVREEREETEG